MVWHEAKGNSSPQIKYIYAAEWAAAVLSLIHLALKPDVSNVAAKIMLPDPT